MEFFKAFGVILAMAVAMGVTILIMVKGDGLLSTVPFFAYLVASLISSSSTVASSKKSTRLKEPQS